MKKHLFIISLLVLTLIASFALPKVKYTSPDVLSKLEIPLKFNTWAGKDISDSIDTRDLRYNFISRVFARQYLNRYGENLLFLILDAGNFHNPKVCFNMAGSTITDLPPVQLKAGGHTFNATSIYVEKGGSGTVLVYWICIDKKQVNWTQQKLTQLFYSLFNKQKVGYMVRFEIPATQSVIQSRQKLAQEFMDALIPQLPQEQVEYLFGK